MKYFNVKLSRAEAEALLRALDLVEAQVLSRNRRDRPGTLRLEEALEEKLLAALGRRPPPVDNLRRFEQALCESLRSP